jgi:hypothetical protein
MDRRKAIVVGLIALIVVVGAVYYWKPKLSISGYQGIHPTFAGVIDAGKTYTNTSPYSSSTCRFLDTSMNFDPDTADQGVPNLMGALQDMTIVRDVTQYIPSDTATHIANLGGQLQPDKPYKTYEWTVDNGDGTSEKYQMELWLCTFDVNLLAKPDQTGVLSNESWNQRYRDSEVWLKLSTGPDWYIEGAQKTYYGLSYMELAQLTGCSDTEMVVIPGAKWEALPIFQSLGGGQTTPATPVTYQGKRLNPDIFRDEWYTCITLGSFGTYNHNFLDGSYMSDSAQFRVLTHVFVVGEWTVRNDSGHVTDPHTGPFYEGWVIAFENWVSGLLAWFNQLGEDLMMSLIYLLIAIIVILAVVAVVAVISSRR